MEQTLANGWSRDILSLQIQANAHQRHGRAVTNFDQHLPSPQSDLARQALKDPYIFDFLTLDEPFHEHESDSRHKTARRDKLIGASLGDLDSWPEEFGK
jgi:predicted nuclease of restriction endonuclease-like (RecB) superfamily